MMASPGMLSSKPGVQKIVDNVKDCVDELKRDFNDTHRPITDDSQILQRFSVNLEFLLRHEQIEKSSFLGGKKDYWNYFIEGLNSVKGVNDGLKFVKSRNELTTNTGRGRAFIRFCLMYQRLADCLQLCTSNKKLTSQWYKPTSVWRNNTQATYLISLLYDLNDVTFDLGAQGYDLDNGWPTFSRSEGGHSGQRWNISSMSRSSSISSLSQSVFSPGSSFMSSSFAESEVQQIPEHGEGRFDTYSTADTENDEADSVDIANMSNGLTDSMLNGESVGTLKTERDNLQAEVEQLKSQLTTSEQQTVAAEGRLLQTEERNKQLVDSLNQLAQDQSTNTSSHIEQLSKYQELMSKYTELESCKSAKERECDQLLSAKSSLDTQLAAITQQCAERDEKISQISEDKANLEDNLSTIANSLMEKSGVIEKMAVTHESERSKQEKANSTLLSDYSSLQEQYQVLQDSQLSLQSQHNSVSIDLSNLRESHRQLELTQTGATDYTASLQGQLSTAQTNYKDSQQDVLRLQAEVKKLEAKAGVSAAQGVELKETNDKLTNQCADLVKATSALQAELAEVKVDSRKSKDKLVKSEREKANLQSQLANKEQHLQSGLTNQEKLSAENTQYKSDILNAQSSLSSLQRECDTLRQHNSMQLSDNSKLERQLSTLQEVHTQLQLDCESTHTLLSQAQQDLSSRDVTLADLRNKHKLELDERSCAHQQLTEQIGKLTNELSALQLTDEESSSERQRIQEQCCRQQEQMSEMEQQLVHIHTAHGALQSAHKELQSVNASLQGELSAAADECNQLQVELDRKSGEYQELVERLDTVQQQMVTSQSEQEQGSLQLSLKCEQLTRHANELQAKMSAATDELASVSAERALLNTRVEEEEQAKLELSTTVSEVNSELESLKSTLKSLKSEALEKGKELSEVQTCLESTKLDLLNKQMIMEQQIGALRFQISSQQMEADLALEGYKTQQEDVNKMSQTISTQERLTASIQLQLDNMIDERSLESDIHKRQVDELVVMLDEKEAEILTLTSEMDAAQERWGSLSETNNSLQQSLVELKLGQGEQIAKAENELHQLREDNVMLKKRLVKLIKDKETLWQTTDDLMSKQQQLKNVVWLASADIYNCMACNSAFTMLLRKHHCRVCGKVYCWQCSNNWVLTANGSGKKKERCCNQCYIEQSDNSLPGSLNTSTITNDNSVDSVTIPTVARRQSSLTPPGSEVSFHINGSESSTSDEKHNVDPSSFDNTASHSGTPSSSPQAAEQTICSENDNGEKHQIEQVNSSTVQSAPEQVAAADVLSEMAAPEPSEFVLTDPPLDELHSTLAADVDESAPVTDEQNEEDLTTRSLLDSLAEEYDVVVSAESVPSNELSEATMQGLSHHTVCVVVNKEDTTLDWKLLSQPKPVYFQLTFKPYATSFSEGSETLIPECKCRSHKQEFQGEMISHDSGLYVFSFINKSSSEVNLRYLISMKQS